jgi:proteasome lid subunit RPN8/RPN11
VVEDKSALPSVIKISRAVFDQINATIGQQAPERGGMLGGNRETSSVTIFHFDIGAECAPAAYSPDARNLKRILREEWKPQGLRLLGMAHSHPPSGPWHPSHSDVVYAERFLDANPELSNFILPIIRSADSGEEFTLFPFIVCRATAGGVEVHRVAIEVIEESKTREELPPPPDSRNENCNDQPLPLLS